MLAQEGIYAIAKTERPELRIDSFLDAGELRLVFVGLGCELLVA